MRLAAVTGGVYAGRASLSTPVHSFDVTRLVFWIGDVLIRFEGRHPVLYWVSMFLFIWIGVALGLHFIARPSSDFSQDMTFAWSKAISISLVVACVGTGIAYFIGFSSRRD